jgi:large subunit ribosomal protein L21
MVYAVVETGGKQLKVTVGDAVDVEKIEAGLDDQVVLDKVLLLSTDGSIKVGSPYVEGAKVSAKVVAQGKGPKIVGFKYKPKKNVRKRYGHRQPFTRLQIESIEA